MYIPFNLHDNKKQFVLHVLCLVLCVHLIACYVCIFAEIYENLKTHERYKNFKAFDCILM